MPDLQNTRRKLKIALVALGVIDVAAIVVLLSPLAGSQRARSQQLESLWRELQQKTKVVEPLRGMDKKIALAKEQIDGFYKDRLPTRDSAIVEALSRVAAQSGVKIETTKQEYKDPEPVGLIPVEVEAQLSGNYLQLMRFVNSLERDQLFFIVNTVALGGQQGGVVKLEIKLETYLKTGASLSSD
jgi:Tfp pilus assembly protein PilO